MDGVIRNWVNWLINGGHALYTQVSGSGTLSIDGVNFDVFFGVVCL